MYTGRSTTDKCAGVKKGVYIYVYMLGTKYIKVNFQRGDCVHFFMLGCICITEWI